MSLSGAVVVTTPQELAVVDVLKGLRMWQVLKVLHAARHIIDGERESLFDFFSNFLDFFSPRPLASQWRLGHRDYHCIMIAAGLWGHVNSCIACHVLYGLCLSPSLV